MGYFPRWFYNTKKGRCESFIYGGCNENANNFKTKQECEQTCSGEGKIAFQALVKFKCCVTTISTVMLRHSIINVFVVVQFYPWFQYYFPHYHT